MYGHIIYLLRIMWRIRAARRAASHNWYKNKTKIQISEKKKNHKIDFHFKAFLCITQKPYPT